MSFDLFINFDGECKQALEFYAKVFNSSIQSCMTYSEMPPDPDYTIPEADKDRIMYSCVPIFGCNVMFCDNPAGMPLVKGNNLSPTLGTTDMDEIKRIFNALKEGGEVIMDLQNTFWSDLYGMVQDKYGIIWNLSHNSGKFEG